MVVSFCHFSFETKIRVVLEEARESVCLEEAPESVWCETNSMLNHPDFGHLQVLRATRI